uniref:Putative secreted protein n=1 Tax=Anopheles darlingi TaxID=43151 RepID=A0A2M4DAS2_ANODA
MFRTFGQLLAQILLCGAALYPVLPSCTRRPSGKWLGPRNVVQTKHALHLIKIKYGMHSAACNLTPG